MPEDWADRFERYEDMTNRLIAMMANQDRINERLTTAIESLAVTQGDIRTTLARVETLLARVLRGDDNGRDA